MSQQQAASLLACAFFCLFPPQILEKPNNTHPTYQSVNFDRWESILPLDFFSNKKFPKGFSKVAHHGKLRNWNVFYIIFDVSLKIVGHPRFPKLYEYFLISAQRCHYFSTFRSSGQLPTAMDAITSSTLSTAHRRKYYDRRDARTFTSGLR